MKSIQLTKVTEKHNNQDVDVTTLDLIKVATNSNPGGGFTATDMQNRLRILDAVEKVNGAEVLELEDSDFNNLAEYVKATKWNIVSKAIVEFSKQFDK